MATSLAILMILPTISWTIVGAYPQTVNNASPTPHKTQSVVGPHVPNIAIRVHVEVTTQDHATHDPGFIPLERRRANWRLKHLTSNPESLEDVRTRPPLAEGEGEGGLVPTLTTMTSANHIMANIDSRYEPPALRPNLGKEDVAILVDGDQMNGAFDHFWRSTGLCPPDPHSKADTFLLGLDEKLNLAFVGSLPHNAVAQVRVHWLFDLVQGSIVDGAPAYSFDHLDAFLDHLWGHQLRPGFELMGNPGAIFTDFENETQVSWWRQLVATTARRYSDRYGLEWISTWNWESWNEPDHHDFDKLNFTLKGFLNYFDSCRAGLNDVSEALVLGGPGGSCRDPSFSRFCWALLEHCDRGSSFFTPGKPPRIDFISFHKKGQEDADSILTQEIETIEKIKRDYPRLRHVPIINDEADFLKGWWRGLPWRADGRYAALVARAVHAHHEARRARPHLHYHLLSFDNAFLNYFPNFFEQRTLIARFQINSTTPKQVQMVKKDSYSIMAFLSLLGDHTIWHTVRRPNDELSVITTCRGCHQAEHHDPEIVDALRDQGTLETTMGPHETTMRPLGTTKSPNEEDQTHTCHLPEEPETSGDKDIFLNVEGHGVTDLSGDLDRVTSSVTSAESANAPGSANAAWEATILVARSNATRTSTDGVKARIVVRLPKHIVGEKLAVVKYRLGGKHKGPYEAWIDLGRPTEPSRKELAFMRSHEGGRRKKPQVMVASHPNLTMSLALIVPDVRVIHLCQVFQGSPGQVVDVQMAEVTRADLLLTWSDTRINTRCLLGYQVEWSTKEKSGPYSPITRRYLHHNNFYHALPSLQGNATVEGWYRVRAVTYWGTPGEFSEPVFHKVG